MTETQLKNKVTLFLNTIPDIYVRKISDRYSSGYPDIWGCLKGKFFAIELKTEKGRTSAIQEYEMKMIRKAGGRVAVCRSVDEVKEFLREVYRDK